MKFLFFVLLIFPGAGPKAGSLAPLLAGYIQVKDALVEGNADIAAKAASGLLDAINDVDMQSLDAADHAVFVSLKEKLSFDARHISESKDINHQREHFVSLSANFFQLAQKTHLSSQPIYEDYCPMRKAYWLSSDAAIVNPYLGGSMRTCGKIAATIKP